MGLGGRRWRLMNSGLNPPHRLCLKAPSVPSDGTAQVTFNTGLWKRFFGAVASAAAR